VGGPEQVRVVALLPDEHEMRRRHEVRDERAARRRARERIGPDAEPAAVVGAVVVRPELLGLLEELLVLEDEPTGLASLGLHGAKRNRRYRRGSWATGSTSSA